MRYLRRRRVGNKSILRIVRGLVIIVPFISAAASAETKDAKTNDSKCESRKSKQEQTMTKKNDHLPPYVHIDVETCPNREVLREPAETITFPLSAENRKVAEILLEKFLNEENCAGLAAPQIGFGKRIIVYAIPEDTKNYRNDADEVVETRILINPEYEPVGDETVVDWEGCFSVANTYGEVPRYQEIRYRAYDTEGRKIEGIAQGFHARLLQHEIGHINGQLFIDLITPECRSGSLEEMRALRKAEMEAKKKRG